MEFIQILTALIPIARELLQGLERDESNEEILKRIAKPGGVGQQFLDDARSRKAKLRDFIENG